MSAPELFLDGRVALHCGDSRDVLRSLPDVSVDSVACDPPYALVSISKRFGREGAVPAKDYVGTREGATGAYARASAGFMGQGWDTGETAFAVEFWREVLRVLKPGGHVVAFGGTRSYHRLTCAIEDAGFEIRDSILELMSLDPIVRAFVQSLDDAQLSAFLRVMDLLGAEGLLAWVYGTGFPKSHYVSKGIDRHNGDARPVIGRERLTNDIRGGALLDAAHDGLRPGFERDMTSAGSATSVAWEGWGTALKPAWEPIILARKPLSGTVAENVLEHGTAALNIDGCRIEGHVWSASGQKRAVTGATVSALGGGLNNSGRSASNASGRWPANAVLDGSAEALATFPGSAARFFYSVKADADDRIGSKHPTVKPVDLMRWLVRLVTPPGGTVLDPFAGTGTTGEAAWREGFSAVLVEREPAYQADIRRRMALCLTGPEERKRESAKARARQEAPAPLFDGLGEAAE